MAALADSLRTAASSPEATVLGTSLSAGGQIGAGIAQRRASALFQQEADTAAGQEQAASQQQAYTEGVRTQLLTSRARAVAAASGGSATDPTVTDIIGRIAGEGAYRSQLALYGGNSAATALRARGAAAAFQGRQAQVAGYTRAFGTVLNGGKTLLDKMGGGPRSVLSSSDFGGVAPYYDPSGWGMS